MKFFLLFSGFFLFSFNVASQNYAGKEFWLGFMNNTFIFTEYQHNPDDFSIYISSKHNASGSVSIPLQNWSVNFTIQADSVIRILIPENLAHPTVFGISDNKGIHVIADSNISVSAFNSRFYSSDGAAILPLNALSSSYIVTSYTGTLFFGDNSSFRTYSEALIVATEDSSQINITPNTNTSDNHQANVTYSKILNKGESYHLRAASEVSDLTGTRIVGSQSCKPFAVFNGTQATYLPHLENCDGAADHLFEQCIPLKDWDTNYVLLPFPSSVKYTFKVFAKENNTIVKLYKSSLVDPNASTNIHTIVLDSGQFYDETNYTGSIFVRSNYPVLVSQYFQSYSCSGSSIEGDPSFLILNSNQTWDKEIVFSTHNNNRMNQHYLTVLIDSDSNTPYF